MMELGYISIKDHKDILSDTIKWLVWPLITIIICMMLILVANSWKEGVVAKSYEVTTYEYANDTNKNLNYNFNGGN